MGQITSLQIPKSHGSARLSTRRAPRVSQFALLEQPNSVILQPPSTMVSAKKKRSIVFFHPDLGIGGAERLVVDAAVGLQQRGHRVTIFTSHCDPSHCFDEARDGKLSTAWPYLARRSYTKKHTETALSFEKEPSMSVFAETPLSLRRYSDASGSCVQYYGSCT